MIFQKRKPTTSNRIFLFEGKITKTQLKELGLASNTVSGPKDYNKLIPFSFDGGLCGLVVLNKDKDSNTYYLEKARNTGYRTYSYCKEANLPKIYLEKKDVSQEVFMAFIEGILLSNYEFIKYKNEEDRKDQFLLKEIQLLTGTLSPAEAREINAIVEAVQIARDLVNEPLSYLTAKQYSEDMRRLSKKFGFKLNVLSEARIRSMKMGGILSVNKGSVNPATFNILEWKPSKCKNSKPIVLVGKGVVYDTGGLSLKPTKNSMDIMKSDMGGSAVVVGLFAAIAAAKLPVHVIGLIPAVENRPGGNAYVPGDVVTMYDGTSVEVLNTDAEGRMILADALTYAKKYSPELVLEYSTLTGSTHAFLSNHATLMMSNAEESVKDQLKNSGDNTFERIVELPIWKEYEEMMVSEIADLKNVSSGAGGITAGCFLHHFTDYPWAHFDIAGTAYLSSRNTYRPKNGTGSGIRFTFDFLKNYK